MTRSWERALWMTAVGLVAATAVAGRIRPSQEDANASSEGPRRLHHRGASDHGNARGPRSRSESELKRQAVHTLSTPLRTERFQRLMEMLDETTAENWMIFWNEFVGQTVKDGRVNETEWTLFMNRVGEVAGGNAMEYFTHNAQNDHIFNRREVMEGWAAVDPVAAHAWLEGQSGLSDADEAVLLKAAVTGVTAADAGLAMDWLGQAPEDQAMHATSAAVEGVIQSEGLENAIKMLEARVNELPDGAAPPAYMRSFYQELKSRAGRIEWLRDSYPEQGGMEPSFGNLDAAFADDPQITR